MLEILLSSCDPVGICHFHHHHVTYTTKMLEMLLSSRDPVSFYHFHHHHIIYTMKMLEMLLSSRDPVTTQLRPHRFLSFSSPPHRLHYKNDVIKSQPSRDPVATQSVPITS